MDDPGVAAWAEELGAAFTADELLRLLHGLPGAEGLHRELPPPTHVSQLDFARHTAEALARRNLLGPALRVRLRSARPDEAARAAARVLLWADDRDGPEPAMVETLTAQAWAITRASTVREAATLLAAVPCEAIVLDQLMPMTGPPSFPVPWAGATLLRWLRRHEPYVPPGCGGAAAWLHAITPHPDNQRAHVIVNSDYFDDDADAWLAFAAPLPRVAKPAHPLVLLRLLQQAG
ncbi:MAG TPA: hypothetical protein PKA64_25805 [Myxococcota bacterium]|nr:hypothetical protein [Myxococcota bacterium]